MSFPSLIVLRAQSMKLKRWGPLKSGRVNALLTKIAAASLVRPESRKYILQTAMIRSKMVVWNCSHVSWLYSIFHTFSESIIRKSNGTMTINENHNKRTNRISHSVYSAGFWDSNSCKVGSKSTTSCGKNLSKRKLTNYQLNSTLPIVVHPRTFVKV